MSPCSLGGRLHWPLGVEGTGGTLPRCSTPDYPFFGASILRTVTGAASLMRLALAAILADFDSLLPRAASANVLYRMKIPPAQAPSCPRSPGQAA